MKRVVLLVIMLLVMPGCTTIKQVKAADRYESKEDLLTFCEVRLDLMEDLFYEVAATDGQLHIMLHEDTENFIPILFAQCKMENIGIMLFSIATEIANVVKFGEVGGRTIKLLNVYIYFLERDILKAKLFKGLIKGSGQLFRESEEQLALKTAVINLTATYSLFVEIKEKLEELR